MEEADADQVVDVCGQRHRCNVILLTFPNNDVNSKELSGNLRQDLFSG